VDHCAKNWTTFQFMCSHSIILQNPSQPSPIFSLVPDEISSLIFGFLDAQTLGQTAQVCRAFRDKGWGNDLVWKAIAFRTPGISMSDDSRPEVQSWKDLVVDFLSIRFIPQPKVQVSPCRRIVTWFSDASTTCLLAPPISTGILHIDFQFSFTKTRPGQHAIGLSSVPTLPTNFLGNDDMSVDWNSCGQIYPGTLGGDHVDPFEISDLVGIKVDMHVHEAYLFRNKSPAGEIKIPLEWKKVWVGVCGLCEGQACEIKGVSRS